MNPPLYCCSVYILLRICYSIFFFFFNDTAPTEIYTLSLHDALPISQVFDQAVVDGFLGKSPFIGVSLPPEGQREEMHFLDRKSTRLNSSHPSISYAVFCLKKKKNKQTPINKLQTTAINTNNVCTNPL